MTTAEAGSELRLSARTVERLIATGKLTASNVGSSRRPRLRVTDEDLARYVASKRLSPVPTRKAGAA